MTQRLTRPRDQIRVLLLEGIHERAEQAFHDAGYSSVTRLADALRGDDLLDAIAETEIIGIRSRTQLTPEVLDAGSKLFAIERRPDAVESHAGCEFE